MKSFPAFLEELRQAKQISKKHLAWRSGLTPGYVSLLTRGERTAPSEETVKALADALELDRETRALFFASAGYSSSATSSTSDDGMNGDRQKEEATKEDWGQFPNVQGFYGRQAELATLEQWIVHDRCQMVGILGLGGIGKTTLAAKLAEHVKDAFDCVFWRSLQHAPMLKTILNECIQFLSDEKKVDLPEKVEDQITQLIGYFRRYRCLVVLDNVESILQKGQVAGQYQEGYEGYGQLLKYVGEVKHQSCLLLTSREKPKEVAHLEGQTLPVRSLHLSGVGRLEGEQILKDQGIFGSSNSWDNLIQLYLGNPLALKLVSETIREVFGGDVASFLEQGEFVFGGIYELLDHQFQRLSELEQEIMYWLAIEREARPLEDLRADLLRPVPKGELLAAIASLRRRSMIETNGAAQFTLQPVIMEYVTDQLVKRIHKELTTEEIEAFANYPLIKAQAKDYIRDSQIRLILQPVADSLLLIFGKAEAEKKLKNILATLRKTSLDKPSYAAGNLLNLLLRLGCDLRDYDFSHLVVWQAYLKGAELRDVNFAYADLAKSVFTEAFGSILSVALSPDGEVLMAGTATGEIRLWQAATGIPLHACQGHTHWVRSVVFSPDGSILASGSDDQTVRLWDTSTGQCIKILQGHTHRVWSVAFSPDETTLASGSADQTVRLWDVSTGQCTKILQGHTRWIRSVAFSPDGTTLASGSDDHTVRLWDVNTGRCLKTLQGHIHWVHSVAFSPDGTSLASGSADKMVCLWDVNTGLCTKIQHSSWVYSVAFSPDGTLLASGNAGKTVRLWNVTTGQCIKILQGHTHRVRSVVFSPDGTTLTTGSDDQTVRIWDVHTGQCLTTLQGHTHQIWSVAFSPDGNILTSGSQDYMVRLWDVHTGQCTKILQGHTHWVRSVTFSPDGNILASGSQDYVVRLWNVHTGQYTKILQGHTHWVRSVTFSPDGNILASGSEDQTVRLWDVYTGQCLKTLQGHTHWVYSVAFSPDGNIIASGSADQTVRLWDVHTGQCLKTLQGHTHWAWSVAFSPDGNIIASGSQDKTVRLWDVHTGQCLKTLQGHTHWTWSVAFSPDGDILASGSQDQTVRLWDVSTGQCLKTLQGHTHWVHSVAFSPDGQVLASGSNDGTIKFWDVKAGICLQTLRSDRPYERMNITHAKGLENTQKDILKALGAIEDDKEK